MGELHPLLESGKASPLGWRGTTGGCEWSVSSGKYGWVGSSKLPGPAPENRVGPHEKPDAAAHALCKACPGLRAWLKEHNLKRQMVGRALRGSEESGAVMLDLTEANTNHSIWRHGYDGAVRGISWSVYSVTNKDGTTWSATANVDAFGKTCLVVGHPTAAHAAEALCIAHPALSGLIQEAGRVFRGKTCRRPTDDPDDLTNDWTTLVAAKDAEIDELRQEVVKLERLAKTNRSTIDKAFNQADDLAKAVSDREGVIERAIEVLTGEHHTYGDQSADMLVAEVGRALDRATKAEAKARQAAHAGESRADRMDVRRHRSTVALRAVVEALSPAGFRLDSDHNLESVALSKAMQAARRIEALERRCELLASKDNATTTADCPF